MKHNTILFFLFLLLLVGGILLYQNRVQIYLRYKGFSEKEIKQIKSLSKADQKYFVNNKVLYPILKEKNFLEKNFSNYIKLYQKKNTLTLSEIILIVNQEIQDETIDLTPQVLQFLKAKDFDNTRLKRYIAYQEKNKSLKISQIIELVNQDIDTITMEYNDNIEDLLQNKYFIKENLERYLTYQDKYKTTADITVSYVNSNLDYPYYTNTQQSNLEKEFLILVNKYYVLPSDYIPINLVTIDSSYGRTLQLDKTAYESFKKMADDAKKENLTLYIQSPYRSYQTQLTLYRNYCNRDGQMLADTYSARAGYSEHQTGLALDITNGAGKSLASFLSTKEFIWMQKNAYKYGFILRYPEGKEKITGYQYEPWHYRYVGLEAAKKIKELEITFDEYYAYYVK